MQSYTVLQSSASYPLVFLLISSSDHISPLTGASPTVTISKNGGSFASPSGAVSEIANGWYKVAGNGTDTATLGPLLLHATASGADPTDCLYPVVSYNPQSATNLGLSALPTANPAANGGLPTCDASDGVKLSVGTGTGQVNVSSGKVPATLASTDVTGNVAADLQTIKSQAVACSAGVTVGAYVGNATAALAVDANGRVDLGEILGTASAGTAGYVGIDWSAIHAPTTAVNLSATTISTSQVVASVSGNVGGSVASVTAVVSANVTEWGGTNVAGVIPPDAMFLHSGTAQAGGASTITLDSGASSTNNLYQNQIIFIRSGTGAGQSAIITSYVGSTKVATIVGSWASNPDNTSVFTVLPFGSITTTVSGGVNVTQWNGTNVSPPNIAGVPLVDLGYTKGSASTGAAGSVGIDWAHVANPTTAVNLSSTTISTAQSIASVSGTVGSVTGAVGSVTGSVGSVTGAVASVTGSVGSVTGSVGSIAGVTFPTNFGSLSINTSGHVQIQGTIQKNTALNGFPFYMALTGGAVPHYSPATGLTITSTVSLNGGAFASTTNNATEIGNGWYQINLSASDTNGTTIALSFAGTGADTTYITITTQP